MPSSQTKNSFKYLALSLGVSLGLALAAAPCQSETARGHVFHDQNGNGRFDSGEKGIANIPVSNGADIVLSDESGAWQLEVGTDTVLFVIGQRNWTPPRNEYQLPKFYYIHKEQGSQQTRYSGIAPTGPLPERIDFPMLPTSIEDKFSIFVFGDPQPPYDEAVDYFARDVIAEVAKVGGKVFGISLGDIVGNDLTLFEPVNDAVSLLGIPWYNVIGNHDINFDVPDDAGSDDTYQSVYGPATYAFNHGKVHFIMLDDVVYGGAEFAAKVRSGEIKDQRAYVGGLREDQFQFIENYLKLVAKDELVVLTMHIPLFQRLTYYYENIESFRKQDRERLFELLKDFPHTVSVSAHTHFQKQYFFTRADGWLGKEPHHHINAGTTSGGVYTGILTYDGVPDTTMRDGTPNGFAIMSFDGNRYELKYKVLGAPEDKQMSLYAPFKVDKNAPDNYLYANFYLGTEFTKAYYRIDDEGDWLAMEHAYEADPRTVLNYEYQKALLTTPSEGSELLKLSDEPHPSSHLWKVQIPAFLEPGFHLAKVRVVDRFGKEYFDTITFRILK